MSERDEKWFPFYAGRFLGNETVAGMNLQETGAYLRLLLSEWNNGSISADLNVLARFLKVSSAEMEILWAGIGSCFTEKPDEPGRLICEFMETVRDEVRKRLENGHNAAVKRWEVRRAKQAESKLEQGLDKSYQDLPRLDTRTEHNRTLQTTNTKPCASDDARLPEQPAPEEKRAKPNREMTPEQAGWFASWWDAYWLHRAKEPARRAFAKHVCTEERFQRVMAAVAAQAPEMLTREPQHRPHGATWLNAERWDDELAQPYQEPKTKAQQLWERI
jgi:hypothetical protein